jgi:hypothetical protein
MATVRFLWSPTLVALRREVCPSARWERGSRQWIMATDDAHRFLQSAHHALDYARSSAQIEVDGVSWTVGFIRGAPFVNSFEGTDLNGNLPLNLSSA